MAGLVIGDNFDNSITNFILLIVEASRQQIYLSTTINQQFYTLYFKMGCGASKEDNTGKARNDEIENQLRRDKMAQRNEIKMLLLGE